MMEAISEQYVVDAASTEEAESRLHDAKVLIRAFRSGKIDLARMCGLEDDEVESGYLRGRQLLLNGLPEKAAQILLGICIMRPTEPRYVRSLEFAYHHMNRHAAAFEMFTVVISLDPYDRISLLMRAECSLAAKGPEEGRKLLEHALAECNNDDPALLPYQQRARTLLRMLQTR
jgi:predicted Zn-dependent protease